MNSNKAAPSITSYSLSLTKALPFVRNRFVFVARQNIHTVLPFFKLQQSRDGRSSLRRMKRSSEHRLVSECFQAALTSNKYIPKYRHLYPRPYRTIVYIPSYS